MVALVRFGARVHLSIVIPLQSPIQRSAEERKRLARNTCPKAYALCAVNSATDTTATLPILRQAVAHVFHVDIQIPKPTTLPRTSWPPHRYSIIWLRAGSRLYLWMSSKVARPESWQLSMAWQMPISKILQETLQDNPSIPPAELHAQPPSLSSSLRTT